MADLAWVSSTYFPSQLPGYLMLDNLFNFGDDYVAAVLAAIDTVDNEPNLKAELAKVDIILLMPHISGHAPIGTKTELKSIKDLKGKSLRTYGGVRTQFYTNIGGNPIFMSFADMYEAMNRGTVDALGDMAIVLANAFKHYEVVKAVYTNAPPGVNGNGGALASGFYMSQKKFNALPKDTQKMLLDLRREYGMRYAQTLMDDESTIRKEWADEARRAGSITPPPRTPSSSRRRATPRTSRCSRSRRPTATATCARSGRTTRRRARNTRPSVRSSLVAIPTDTVALDGLWYEPEGDAVGAALLLHGNTMNFYQGAPRFLAPALAGLGFACLAFNRRGHDILAIRDSRAAEGAAFQTYAEAIEDNRIAARWVAERGFAEPIVVGHSNGGLLAAHHVAEHPARRRSCCCPRTAAARRWCGLRAQRDSWRRTGSRN